MSRSGYRHPIGGTAQVTSFGPYNFPGTTDFFSLFGGIGQGGVDFNVASPNLVMAVGGGVNTTLCLIPWAVSGVLGQNQYSQLRQVANTGTAVNPTRPALFLFCRGISSTFDNSLTSFYVRWRVDVPSLEILTSTAYNPQTHVVIATLGSAPANGDTVRFEGRRNGANVDLTVKINGAIVLTVSSALLPPANQGLPGFGVGGTWTGGAVQFSMTAFECGILT